MTAIPQIPVPDAQTLALGVLMLIGGMTVPTGYGIERINGFGRWVVSKLPYKAPPGVETEQAMVEATDAVDASEVEEIAASEQSEGEQ
ncbi:hypothetical protein VB773_01405 [Haloarculaceae archaeon H-GB2-1]|nr:hypothetical protein [Haloarculaceae archaeon H-GB1-1]MEA5406370.1 hypothetical protein [Haloarculaceae archaeon H-GB2-1]